MRSEFHVDSVKILVIESRFLAVNLTGPDVPSLCLSTVSDVLPKTILDWRLISASSLAEATVFVLNSLFQRASETDPPPIGIGHRY